MKIISEKDFRGFKKINIGLTNKLEECVDLFEVILMFREELLEEGYELSENQLSELSEYEDRINKCLERLEEY